MIVVKLIGGLGNQMFQYAFARSLALKNKTQLKLDITGFDNHFNTENYTNRNFELNVFNITSEIASAEEISPFIKTKFGKAIDFISFFLPFKSNHFYLREPYFHFFEKALTTPATAYIDGYWHSEKYFKNIRTVLLEEFSLKEKLTPELIRITEEIKASNNSVAIHIRKGDYISNPINKAIYKELTADYYQKAIQIIINKFPDAVFYIFSDEPEWFQQNVQTTENNKFIKMRAGNKSYEDLFLMSLCKHNIIANSSFSWWGAWLNTHESKIVIAPQSWYIGNDKNTKDLIPENWIQI